MPVTGANTVVSRNLATFSSRSRPRTEVEFHCLPSVAAFRLEAEAGGRFIAAMSHAIFAARIFRYAINHAILVPIDIREQLGIGVVMSFRADGVGHEITGR